MGAEGTDPAAGLPDIRTDADVHRLVERFYEKAPADPLIGHFFAGLDLSAHVPRIAAFWQRLLLGSGDYQGEPMSVHRRLHARLPMEAEHFERWLALWSATVREHFQGTKADEAIDRAGSIARVMMHHVLGRLP
ncbi:MAG TPA: group III truncated hemoglobin [Flavobacteriales bacterium]|nr:group III truncated hemoglobin [Flavobacteriales bacterium]